MKRLLIALVCLAPATTAAQGQLARAALSDQEREGRRIFQQKCALCHLPILPIDGSGTPYAGRLSKSTVEGKEEYVRRVIANGARPRMPGWQYTLRPDQIDALVNYLKTVETPGRTVGAQVPEF